MNKQLCNFGINCNKKNKGCRFVHQDIKINNSLNSSSDCLNEFNNLKKKMNNVIYSKNKINSNIVTNTDKKKCHFGNNCNKINNGCPFEHPENKINKRLCNNGCYCFNRNNSCNFYHPTLLDSNFNYIYEKNNFYIINQICSQGKTCYKRFTECNYKHPPLSENDIQKYFIDKKNENKYFINNYNNFPETIKINKINKSLLDFKQFINGDDIVEYFKLTSNIKKEKTKIDTSKFENESEELIILYNSSLNICVDFNKFKINYNKKLNIWNEMYNYFDENNENIIKYINKNYLDKYAYILNYTIYEDPRIIGINNIAKIIVTENKELFFNFYINNYSIDNTINFDNWLEYNYFDAYSIKKIKLDIPFNKLILYYNVISNYDISLDLFLSNSKYVFEYINDILPCNINFNINDYFENRNTLYEYYKSGNYLISKLSFDEIINNKNDGWNIIYYKNNRHNLLNNNNIIDDKNILNIEDNYLIKSKQNKKEIPTINYKVNKVKKNKKKNYIFNENIDIKINDDLNDNFNDDLNNDLNDHLNDRKIIIKNNLFLLINDERYLITKLKDTNLIYIGPLNESEFINIKNKILKGYNFKKIIENNLLFGILNIKKNKLPYQLHNQIAECLKINIYYIKNNLVEFSNIFGIK